MSRPSKRATTSSARMRSSAARSAAMPVAGSTAPASVTAHRYAWLCGAAEAPKASAFRAALHSGLK